MNKIIALDEDFGTMVYANIAVVVWTGHARLDAILSLKELGELALSSNNEGALMAIAEKTTTPPSSEARAAAAHINYELVQKGAVGAAAVLDAQGFRGAVFRGMITSLQIFAPVQYPFKCFDSVRGAGEWFNGRFAGSSLQLDAFENRIAEFRQEVCAFRETTENPNYSQVG